MVQGVVLYRLTKLMWLAGRVRLHQGMYVLYRGLSSPFVRTHGIRRELGSLAAWQAGHQWFRGRFRLFSAAGRSPQVDVLAAEDFLTASSAG